MRMGVQEIDSRKEISLQLAGYAFSRTNISNGSSKACQGRSTTRCDANILPCIDRLLSLAETLVVQVCNGFAERFQAGDGTVFVHQTFNGDLFWSLWRSRNISCMGNATSVLGLAGSGKAGKHHRSINICI
jgi:hypothetical protein